MNEHEDMKMSQFVKWLVTWKEEHCLQSSVSLYSVHYNMHGHD